MPDVLRLLNRLNPFVYPANLIDILVVALIFFWLLEAIKGTRAVRLLRGLAVGLGVALLLSFLLRSVVGELSTFTWLIEEAIRPVLIVSIPVIFQPELRRALEHLGRTGHLLSQTFGSSNGSEWQTTITNISRAAAQLSKQHTGALIVIERGTRLQEYVERGITIDARVAVPLLLNIFYPNSPLHDMAVIVRDNRLLAANVVLPLSEDIIGHRRYGTRHRAAKGISEQTDAVTVVVSEETGAISLVSDGRMVSYLNEARLRTMLAHLLRVELEEQQT
jgi:uncharacterized protein (TIGR00159 family)